MVLRRRLRQEYNRWHAAYSRDDAGGSVRLFGRQPGIVRGGSELGTSGVLRAGRKASLRVDGARAGSSVGLISAGRKMRSVSTGSGGSTSPDRKSAPNFAGDLRRAALSSGCLSTNGSAVQNLL